MCHLLKLVAYLNGRGTKLRPTSNSSPFSSRLTPTSRCFQPSLLLFPYPHPFLLFNFNLPPSYLSTLIPCSCFSGTFLLRTCCTNVTQLQQLHPSLAQLKYMYCSQLYCYFMFVHIGGFMLSSSRGGRVSQLFKMTNFNNLNTFFLFFRRWTADHTVQSNKFQQLQQRFSVLQEV